MHSRGEEEPPRKRKKQSKVTFQINPPLWRSKRLSLWSNETEPPDVGSTSKRKKARTPIKVVEVYSPPDNEEINET